MKIATVQEAINGNSNDTAITPLRLKQVLNELDISSGGGGGSVGDETDPIFNSSPAAGITTSNIASWNNKQDPLVSGQNIKTINGQNILGEGNITIESGSDDTVEVSVGPGEPTNDEKVWFQTIGNLFNKDTVVDGGRILENGNVHTWNNDCCCSDYIEVQPNTQYTLSGGTKNSGVTITYHNCYYDENKNCISSFLVASGTQTITTPANAKYMRFTVYNTDKNTFQFEKGSVATEYKPYSTKQSINILSDDTYKEFLNVDNLLTKDDNIIVEESDPTVPDYVKAITQEDIAKWNSGTGSGTGSGGGGSVTDFNTEWINAELTDDFKLYNASSYCRYAKTGNIVNIQFVLSPAKADNVLNSATETTAFNIPEEYRPSQNINVLCQGSGTNIFNVGVNVSGNVNIYRYRNSASYSSTPPSTTAWLPCNIVYFIDEGTLVVGGGGSTGNSTLDPVPINSIFDYEGDTVPDGFVEVEEEDSSLYYKDGDKYIIPENSYINVGGCLTASRAQVRFGIFTPKLLKNITSITVNYAKLAIRSSAGGYILNMVEVTDKIYTEISGENAIYLSYQQSSAMSGTNNTPVAVEINGLELTFNEDTEV